MPFSFVFSVFDLDGTFATLRGEQEINVSPAKVGSSQHVDLDPAAGCLEIEFGQYVGILNPDGDTEDR